MRRLLIVVVLLLVVGGVAAFVVLRNQNPPQPASTPRPGQTQVAQNPASTVQPTNVPAPTAAPTIEIVVALQTINRGQVITPDVITIRSWPDSSAPASAIFDPELVVGRIARTDIDRESPIKSTDIVFSLADLASVGSDLAAIAPPGTRLIAVPVDLLTSVSYAIQPGDRIDIVISALFMDLDEDFQSALPNDIQFIILSDNGFTLAQPVDGRFDTIPFSYTLGEGIIQSAFPVVIRPDEEPRPRLVTQMTVQDGLVAYIGIPPADGRIFRSTSDLDAAPAEAAPTDGTTTPPTSAQGEATAAPPPVAQTVILAVSPQEAMVLAYLIETGVPMTFLLRPANETGLAAVQQVDLDYIMNAYRITVPRKLPYGLEPAIRSVRQLVRAETIELGTPSGDE